MSDELETTGVGTATETEVRDDGDVSTHTDTDPSEDTTGDDAALATLNKAFDESDGAEGDEGDDAGETGEGGEAGDQTAGEQQKTEDAGEALEPELLAAASFAGLEEKDLRDAIAAVGKDKAVAMLSSMIGKASERWGLQTGGGQDAAAQQQAAQQAQAHQQQQQAPAAGDPFAAFESPDFAKELVEDFPEAKPLVDSTRQIARIAREQREVMVQMANVLSAVMETVGNSEASDMMEFFQQVDPDGTVYGNPLAQPTPEQLAARKRLDAGARQYQRGAGRPMRFSAALKDAHAALTIGKNNAPSGKVQAAQAAQKKRDILPRSAGTAAPKGTSSQALDAQALTFLRTKYGLK